MMSSMTRLAILFPLLLIPAASTFAQVPAASPPVYRPPAINYPINIAIADWRRLRTGNGYSFADYARFLINNPEWPAESTLRTRAERAMRPGEAPATVLAFFQTQAPVTGNGHARLADALLQANRQTEAIAAARNAWASSDLSAADEQAIFARFGAQLRPEDHDRRADALLFDKQASSAQRVLGMVSPARRRAFMARVAMQLRLPEAESLYGPLMSSVVQDAGLMMDRARYLRDAGSEHAAQQLFARPRTLIHRPADTERFLDMILLLGRSAVDARQYGLAFNIARQVDDLFAPGTDLATQPYGVRDNYTSVTWLGGTAAYSLGRPGDAVGLFERYARGGKSAQVETKGFYWAGRAATAARRFADANNFFGRAAAYPELFYGQLALERIGRSVPRPNPLPTFAVTGQQRAAFASRRLVQATRAMLYGGSSSEQTMFIRAMTEALKDDADRTLAVEFGQQLGRQDIPVWVARSARINGAAFYVAPAFPTVASAAPSIWSLAHGITRQESSFDSYQVSHAGARGMMQLMPPTARELAGKMGLPYDQRRLTSDPGYNVQLGTRYLQQLIDYWDGNVPLAVASYNAGMGNVRKWVNRFGDPRRPGTDIISWIEQIPFSETKGYVQRVIENSVVYDSMRGQQQSAMHVSRYLGKSRPG